MYSIQKVFVFHQNLWNKIKQACICPEFTFKILFSRILGKLENTPYAKKWRGNECGWWKVLNKLLSFSGSPSTTNIVLQKTVKSCYNNTTYFLIMHLFFWSLFSFSEHCVLRITFISYHVAFSTFWCNQEMRHVWKSWDMTHFLYLLTQ